MCTSSLSKVQLRLARHDDRAVQASDPPQRRLHPSNNFSPQIFKGISGSEIFNVISNGYAKIAGPANERRMNGGFEIRSATKP
jgi:hypothetical protein